MKESSVLAHLDCALLRYVRDIRPSEPALLTWLGPRRHGTYHALRKASLLRVEEGVVVLDPSPQGEEGGTVHFADHIYRLDDNVVQVVRRGRGARR